MGFARGRSDPRATDHWRPAIADSRGDHARAHRLKRRRGATGHGRRRIHRPARTVLASHKARSGPGRRLGPAGQRGRRRAGNHIGRHRDRRAPHGLGATKGVCPHHGRGLDVAIGQRRRAARVVVDDNRIEHRRAHAGGVYTAQIVPANRITRTIDLVGREGRPADGVGAADVPANAAQKRHQSRGIDGLGGHAARNPRPAAIDLSPAAIVERREAPGLVIDPGIAPRFDKRPVTITIRRPVGWHRSRIPDLAVLRIAGKVAGGVEIAKTGDGRVAFAPRAPAGLAFAIVTPVVDSGVLSVLELGIITRVDHRALAGFHRRGTLRRGRFGPSLEHGHLHGRI